MELSHEVLGRTADKFIEREVRREGTRDVMRLTVFQWIGLVGLALIVLGIVPLILPSLAFLLPSGSGLASFALFTLGGILLWVGILGNIVLVIYRAGAERERRRLGLPPSGR